MDLIKEFIIEKEDSVKPVPQGEAEVQIEDASLKAARTGTPQLVVTYKDDEDRKITGFYSITEDALWKANDLFSACGIDEFHQGEQVSDKSVKGKLNQLRNKKLGIEIGAEVNDQEDSATYGRSYNRVQGHFALTA